MDHLDTLHCETADGNPFTLYAYIRDDLKIVLLPAQNPTADRVHGEPFSDLEDAINWVRDGGWILHETAPSYPEIGSMSLADITAYLVGDGYPHLASRAKEIRRAARNGCLLWTTDRITTTDSSRIDEVPR